MSNYPYDVDVNTTDRSASVVQIESNKLLPAIIILAAFSAASLVGSAMTYFVLWDKYQIVERECRLAQDDVTKYMQRGIK